MDNKVVVEIGFEKVEFEVTPHETVLGLLAKCDGYVERLGHRGLQRIEPFGHKLMERGSDGGRPRTVADDEVLAKGGEYRYVSTWGFKD